MKLEAWGHGEEVTTGSRHWAYRIRSGPVEVKLHVYCHSSANPALGDRWVWQPSLTWDRRPETTP